MTQGHPVIERYLTCFETSISKFDFPDREEVTDEIRNHIAEARAAGRALDAVLQTLGPADVLARAYAVELALNPQATRRLRTSGGFVKAIVALGKRVAKTLGGSPRAIVALGKRVVRMLGWLPSAIVGAGTRLVRTLVRLPKTIAAAGLRLVRTLGGFLGATVTAGMRRVRTLGGFLRVAAIVVAASLATLVVVTTAGAIGIGFPLSGLFLLVTGILEAAEIHLPDVPLTGMSPVVAMTLSPVLMVTGVGALLLLRLYIQFLVTARRKVFPTARGTELASHS